VSIRQNRSAEISAAINQQFYNIIRLSEQADQITEIGYQSTQLLQDIEEIGFYFTSYGNFCDIIESRRSFHVHYFFFDLDICSYRVGKLLSIAIVLQLESCCFMEIHQI